MFLILCGELSTTCHHQFSSSSSTLVHLDSEADELRVRSEVELTNFENPFFLFFCPTLNEWRCMDGWMDGALLLYACRPIDRQLATEQKQQNVFSVGGHLSWQITNSSCTLSGNVKFIAFPPIETKLNPIHPLIQSVTAAVLYKGVYVCVAPRLKWVSSRILI